MYKRIHTEGGAQIGLGLIEELSATYPASYRAGEWEGHASNRVSQLRAGDRLLHLVTGKEDRILRTAEGRPYLDGTPLRISLSHTEKWIGVIAHTSIKPALDIESIHRDVSKVARKFTTPEEISIAEDFFPQNPPVLIWSAKECLFKAMRTHGVHFKEDLQLMRCDSDDPLHTIWNVRHTNISGVYSVKSFIFEGLLVSYIDQAPE